MHFLRRYWLPMNSNTEHKYQRIALGKFGEEAARRFLKNRNYKIVNKNYRTPFGEIDIVAYKQRSFIFVEVKTRTSLNFGLPEEAVGKKKRISMIKAARFYMKKHNVYGCDAMFGVISIITKSGQALDIKFIDNAFGEE